MGVMVGTEIQTLDSEEYETKSYPEMHWWYIRDSERHWVYTTRTHQFYDSEGFPKQAQDFEPGDIIVHKGGDFEVVESDVHFRVSSKTLISMTKIHLYWANGFLSRDVKLDSL